MQELMIVEELAKYLKISITTVYRKVDKGIIPHFKIDPDGEKSSIRFSKEEIDKWLLLQGTNQR